MQTNMRVANSPGQVVVANRGPVLVCGAGAAGIAAALAAARCGAEVWLVESRERIGGTVVHALIHTLGGFFDADGELINRGLPQELVETLERAESLVVRRKMGRTWVLVVPPELYLDVVERMVAREFRIRLLTLSHVTGVECRDGRVVRLSGLIHQTEFHVAPRAVIDATGTAELVRRLTPALVDDDPRRAAGGLIFRLRGVRPGAIDFPNGLNVLRALHKAAAEGSVPDTCRHAWIDRGVVEDEVYVKLFWPTAVPQAVDHSATRSDHQQRTQTAVVDFLRRQPGFERAQVSSTGQIGIRDGGRVRGDYQLTGSDVRQGRRFDDAACRCCWPLEYWDPERGLSLEYLPMNSSYDIPLRSLHVRGLHNVWVAGKCLSADREAQASARVVGSCWAMGEAAGRAAVTQTMTGELSNQP
jgi:FAD dependent oxidoreductase